MTGVDGVGLNMIQAPKPELRIMRVDFHRARPPLDLFVALLEAAVHFHVGERGRGEGRKTGE